MNNQKQAELGEFIFAEIGECQTFLVDKLLANNFLNFEDIVNYYKPSETDEDGEQEPKEIFEWWLATDWMIGKLKEKGEPILETEYGQWWGRTCTGQVIKLDSVIEEIYDDLQEKSWN